MADITQVRQDLKDAFRPVRDALAANRARLAAVPDLVVVRPGFSYGGPAPAPAAVLAFMPPLARATAAIEQEYRAILGVPARAAEATPEEQLRYLGSTVRAPLLTSEFDRFLQDMPPDFRAPVRGTYQPPAGGPGLDLVEDEMELTLATSPDSGWPVLEEFLAQPVQHRMQIGIYQFTAPHIYRQLRRTMMADDDARLRITLHPVPEKIRDEGSKADDIYGPDILDRLRRALGARFDFEWMSVGAERAFGSSYHIKVAVADSKRMWLSSGNWQTSNQPPYDPLGKPAELPPKYLTSYNREHHVVIHHAALAKTFEHYLQHDYSTGAAQPGPFGVAPDLFVADDALEPPSFAPPRYFAPLRIKRKVAVQPLLTPDNYAPEVVKLIQGAKHSVWLQNQYINFNPDGTLPEFGALLGALHDQLHAGLDVRIICRDLMKPEKLDLLVALGFDPARIKFLKNTHTKVIIVDGERVVIGSHNWSNEGVASNRDASLLFFDSEIAQHCAGIFAYDWDRARPSIKQQQPRVARDDDRPSPGSVRLAWESVFDEMPAIPLSGGAPVPAALPQASAPAAAMAFAAAAAGSEKQLLVVNGIDATSGRYLSEPEPLADIAARLKKQSTVLPEEVRRAAAGARMKAFGPLIGVDTDRIAQSGWAVVVPQGDNGALLEAIQPLVQHRRSQVPDKLFKILEYRPGEQVRDWLLRHGVTAGNVTPAKLPYHLLLLGGPTLIPFEFQYLLDLEYSVGRLAFDTNADYRQYAAGVVAYEKAPVPPRTRDAAFFAPQHAGDAATKLSLTQLAEPLVNGGESLPKLTEQIGFRIRSHLAGDASRSALVDLFKGGQFKPSLLFTAGHGMGFPAGHAQQVRAQGGLLTQDWTGFGTIQPNHYVTAADIPDEADVHGLVAFLFACYGAGTPAADSFPFDLGVPAPRIAEAPFVAALPRRLLSHPRGAALGVFGHIERAWGFSITGASSQPQLNPFWNAFARVMQGSCLGNVTRDFNERAALLSSELADSMGPGGKPMGDEELVVRWIERNDARAYILLGDPGARVRSAELA